MEFEGTVYSNIHHLDQQLQQCYKDPKTVVEDMPDLLSPVTSLFFLSEHFYKFYPVVMVYCLYVCCLF